MPLYQAIVLAIVQGLTEFLPISSTAHLILFPWFFRWNDPGLTFDVALHAGTLVAVLAYFWRYWMDMFATLVGVGPPRNPDSHQNRKLLWLLAVATVPAGLAGWFFESAAERQFRHPAVVAAALISIGVLMWAADHFGNRQRDLGRVNLADSLWVGMAQAMAIVPGVSRSGVTMTAGLFRGMTRETAARFSFLLSTPIIGGAALKEGVDLLRTGIPPEMHLAFVVGVIVAALVGYLAIWWLMRFLERRTFKIFVVYRILLGVLIFALGAGLGHHAG